MARVFDIYDAYIRSTKSIYNIPDVGDTKKIDLSTSAGIAATLLDM